MSRLSVISDADDRELDAIRRIIVGVVRASGVEAVGAALRAQAEHGNRSEVLDVIGHSCSAGFLVIGEWVIDDSAQTAASFSELLRPSLERVGVRTIRLLGCSTAVTARGRNAIRRIARATRCDVLGTRRFVSAHDYGPAGFSSSTALQRVASEPRRRSETRDRNI